MTVRKNIHHYYCYATCFEWKDILVNLNKFSFVSVFCLFLAGCNTGIKEFELYSTAFALQNETAQQILDKVAHAERWHWSQLDGGGSGFSPDQAAYYVNAGDPPYTDSMRLTLKALEAYNAALIGLTNGQAVEAIRGKVSTIVTNIDTATSILAAGRFAPSQEIVSAVLPTASDLATANTIFKTIANSAAKDSFRKQLARAYPSMKKVLLTFRNGSDDLYFAVVSVRGVTKEQRLKDRELFASWVLLIDDTLETMETAVIAVQSNMLPADIDALAEQSVELRILAEKLKAARNRQ
ncbi:MAG: hypothetical protein ABJO86_19065 [Lentilitoribacter sp.]